MAHVKSQKACEAKTMAWYSAPYPEPGMFALKGAESVLLDLVKYQPALVRQSIEEAARSASKKKGKVNQALFKKNLAAERKAFPTIPHKSVGAAGAVFTRLLTVIGNPKKASKAEKELVQAFKNYIIAKRTHIAQDALDAYDAWKIADTYWKNKSGRNSGMAVLFDYGTVPPDFTSLALANSIGMGVLDTALAEAADRLVGDAVPIIGDIVSLGLNIATNTDSVTDPSQIYRWGARTAAEIAVGKAAEFAVNKLAKAAASSIIKQATKSVVIGASRAASQSAAGVLQVAGSAGPQIIITASMMIATIAIDQVTEIANARPKLQNALATAKYPPNLNRMAKTEEGVTELMGCQIIANHNLKPSSAFMKTFPKLATAALNTPIKSASNKKTSSSAKLTGRWQRIKGSATDIGVGANGRVWVIGNKKEAGGFGIFGLDKNKRWRKIKGSAMRITVGSRGYPWVVNNKGAIFRYDGRRWLPIKGPKAVDISVGARGHVWVIGGKKEAGGHGIYRLEKNKQWRKINGSAVRIAVGPKGNAWVVNNKGGTFRFDGRRWRQLKAPKAIDIGIGANGRAWLVGGKKGRFGYPVWSWTGKSWKKASGELTAISVGPKGRPFGVNAKRNIFVMK